MVEAVRKRPPNRREHETLEFDHAGFHYTAGIGLFENGGLAEIFLNCAKSGTTLESHARDAAIVASIALQHGATAETIRHAITRNRDGTASGALGVLLDRLSIEDGTP